MFHDQHVSHKWHVFAILFFLPVQEPYMGISSVGSFPVQSGGSLIIIFQLFRCRNLALNRMFLLYLRGRYVLHLRGHLYTPCTFVHPLHSDAPDIPDTCMSPMLPCASEYSRGICM